MTGALKSSVHGREDPSPKPLTYEIQMPKVEKRPPIMERAKAALGSKKPSKEGAITMCQQLFPISDWLVNYKWKANFVSDIVAGFTIAVMHIPQGMAYALLASVTPIFGIYTGVFPVIAYILLGPSHHISMGTNPLSSMLVGVVMSRNAYVPPEGSNMTVEAIKMESEAKSTEIMQTLALMCGVWQVVLCVLQLGKLTWILSSVVVSAYTCSAAFHVATSQVKGIFGVPIPERDVIVGKIFYTYYDLALLIPDTNVAALIVAVVAMVILIVNDEYLKPFLSKYCKFPVPIQMIVVVLGTLVSYLGKFNTHYAVDVVGEVPTGFPTPVVPSIKMVSALMADSIIIAVVSYSISLSVAKSFAKKFQYKVDGSQELFSEGVSNLFGAFFNSLPAGASMSRSAVQVNSGGKTQMTSIVSVGLLIFVLLFIGPYFRDLPKAVLSAIIVVALKGMFMQYKDLMPICKKSKYDGFLWIGTFVAVILLDINYGLIVSCALAIMLLVYRTYRVYIDESIFEVTDSDGKVMEGVQKPAVVLRFGGSINFANAEKIFDQTVREKLENVDPTKPVVLDFENVNFIDQVGADALINWVEKKNDPRAKVVTGARGKVQQMLEKCSFPEANLFHSVQEALKHLAARASKEERERKTSVAVVSEMFRQSIKSTDAIPLKSTGNHLEYGSGSSSRTQFSKM